MSEESWIQCSTYVNELIEKKNQRNSCSIVLIGLANIPESIVELAQTKALEFERWVTLKRILLTLKKVTDHSQTQQQDLLQFLSKLKLN